MAWSKNTNLMSGGAVDGYVIDMFAVPASFTSGTLVLGLDGATARFPIDIPATGD